MAEFVSELTALFIAKVTSTAAVDTEIYALSREAFQRVDRDNSGYLNREELKEFLCGKGEAMTDEEASASPAPEAFQNGTP